MKKNHRHSWRLLLLLGISAFSPPGQRYTSEIAKNLDIFASLFKRLTPCMLMVNPNQLIHLGIDAMLNS